MLNLGKFHAIGLGPPPSNPCYSTENTATYVTVHSSLQRWAHVPKMLLRLESVPISLLLHVGLPPKNLRILSFVSSPIASAFLLCFSIVPLIYIVLLMSIVIK